MKSQAKEQKLPESGARAKKPRFRIVKLEERIAPRHSRSHYYNYPGWYKHGWSGPPGQVR